MTRARLRRRHDFFHSSTWYVLRNLAIFFVVVFWLATVYWVYKDARRRIEDRSLVWRRDGARPRPVHRPAIYMLFRPPEYLEDVRERDLEIRAMEKRLGARDLHCPVCRAEVEEDFLVCPVCTTGSARRASTAATARGALAGLPVLRDARSRRRRRCRSAAPATHALAPDAAASPQPLRIGAPAWPSSAP